MNITDLADKYKEQSELQNAFDAQTMVLIKLQKKIKEIEEKNKHLETLLKNTNPIIVNLDEQGLDEELIARSQLRMLRQLSQERELNTDEAKRTEIYHKILQNLANKSKVIEVRAKNMDTKELAAALESDDINE